MGGCNEVHVHIRRIPIEEVPRKEDEVKTWLHDVFVRKDR